MINFMKMRYRDLKIRKLKRKFQTIGYNVEIVFGSEYQCPEKITIGNNVYIGPRCHFFGYGGIHIGSGTIIAHNVEIQTRNHNYDSQDLRSIPYDSRYIFKAVNIGENVWIGSNVSIVPGVKIGEGAVIGMGSVVVKNIPSYSIVGGNPARIIKYRDINRYELLKEEKKIYLSEKKHEEIGFR